MIDDLVVGVASDERRYILTAAHPDETIDEVKDVVATLPLDVDPAEPIQEVRLSEQ